MDVSQIWIANFISNSKTGSNFNFGGPYGWPCETPEGFSYNPNAYGQIQAEDLRPQAVTTGAVPKVNASQQAYSATPVKEITGVLAPVRMVLSRRPL